jgi:hypothetical protein
LTFGNISGYNEDMQTSLRMQFDIESMREKLKEPFVRSHLWDDREELHRLEFYATDEQILEEFEEHQPDLVQQYRCE